MALCPMSNYICIVFTMFQKGEEYTYGIWEGDGSSKVDIDRLEYDGDTLPCEHGLCTLVATQ